MDMRPLKTIALCFGLTAGALASLDVSPVFATHVLGGKSPQAVFWLRSMKAIGGGEQFRDRIGADNYEAVWACSASAACREHFGKKMGENDFEDARNHLSAEGGFSPRD
jgi:hypothetical protein